jgi:hypothetical protein
MAGPAAEAAGIAGATRMWDADGMPGPQACYEEVGMLARRHRTTRDGSATLELSADPGRAQSSAGPRVLVPGPDEGVILGLVQG